MNESNENRICPKCGSLMSKPKDLMDIMTENGFGHLYIIKCEECGHFEKFTKGIDNCHSNF